MAHRSVVRLLTVAATALLVGSLGCQQTAKVAETPDTGSEWSEAPDTTLARHTTAEESSPPLSNTAGAERARTALATAFSKVASKCSTYSSRRR